MIKFLCNKLGRDKGLESFKAEGITPEYEILSGDELSQALKNKLIEESNELFNARDKQERISELADVLEVIDGLYKAYGISADEVERVKKTKYNERGGFEKGFFVKTLAMDKNSPKAKHFQASPEKYPEIK